MLSAILLACSILIQGPNASTSPLIRQIEIEGNFRFPSRTVLSWLSQWPGEHFSAVRTREDLAQLHRLGVFETVEVESRLVVPGIVDLVYRVRERPFVSSFSLVGVNDAPADLIGRTLRKQNLDIRPGTPLRPERARKAAEAVRRVVRERRYPLAEVEISGERHGSQVQVFMEVRQGRRIEIGAIRFLGNRSISTQDLLRRMGNSRPARLLTGWTGAGRFLPGELESSLEAVRKLYLSRGYAGVAIGKPEIVTKAFPARRKLLKPWILYESQKIVVRIPIVEGPAYTTRSVVIEGSAGTASSEVSGLVRELQIPGRYDYGPLESTRERIQEALGRHGYALGRVELVQRFAEAVPAVDAIFRVSAGDAVLIKRVDFTGNLRLPDRFLRRELRVKEGEIYDSSRLDGSIRRLNRSGLIQDLHRDDVTLRPTPDRTAVDLVFNVRERDRHGVYGTGGTGGVTGGYLGAICTAFNLLGLGERLSFELDGGSAQSNALLNLAMDRFMGGPFSVGFSLAHRITGLNASNIVPGPRQIMSFLRIRSTAGAVRGTYRVGAQIGIGVGIQVERGSAVTTESEAGAGNGKATSRLTLQPSFSFDSTDGVTRPGRGFQFLLAPAWSAPFPLKAADCAQQSARLKIFLPDPLSGGRDEFAFRIVGAGVRPLGGGGLPVQRRLFPGDEVLRGFANGAISPWSYDPGLPEASRQIQPAGADSVLAFSSEYRVPIYRALSGAAFLDLGWVGLSRGSLAGAGPATAIVVRTNRLLRASMGGEVRLLVPGLHQPARLVFAWNPLRLRGRAGGFAGIGPLVDPSHSVRFALGNVF